MVIRINSRIAVINNGSHKKSMARTRPRKKKKKIRKRKELGGVREEKEKGSRQAIREIAKISGIIILLLFLYYISGCKVYLPEDAAFYKKQYDDEVKKYERLLEIHFECENQLNKCEEYGRDLMY
ncbi:MAG: hypothetical protein KC483_10775 [Nitrosarchaeum sp.]|nr:hypothetical protein [Nitrosarchaeum sp.]